MSMARSQHRTARPRRHRVIFHTSLLNGVVVLGGEWHEKWDPKTSLNDCRIGKLCWVEPLSELQRLSVLARQEGLQDTSETDTCAI